MPRDTRLTLWPEQMAYYPFISSWADIKKKDILDFTECLGVHSCGLTATLLNLHDLFKANSIAKQQQMEEKGRQLSFFHDEQRFENKSDQNSEIKSHFDVINKNSIQRIVRHKDSKLMQDCINLNFFNYIKDYLYENHHGEYCPKVNKQPIESHYFSIDALSYPIFKFNFTEHKNDRRNSLLGFLDYFVPVFRKMSKQYLFKSEQFITILYEIAKNSADHTDGDAYMGLDFFMSRNSAKACVLIGDLGPGIYRHIRDALLQQNSTRKGKIGFAEGYRWALKKGFSTQKDSGRNKGLGMPCAVNNSIALGVHLSVIDVKSRLILSSLKPISEKEPSHNKIWRISSRMDGKRPFFYYLQYEVPSK